MSDAGQGALVGIASVAGFRGLPGSGAYSASKAAAISYLESLRVEQRGTGVAVLTVCPGYIATPMTEQNPYPMPFLLDVDEAARRIVRAIDRRTCFYVLPWQMAVGPRGSAKGQVELKNRKSGEKLELGIDVALQRMGA